MHPRDGPGGIRASDLKAPSLNCLVVHPPDPPKIQNPASKIQNFQSKGDFGFWIVISSIPLREAPAAPNFGFPREFWILDFGFGALCSNSCCANFGFCILVWGRFRGHFLDATKYSNYRARRLGSAYLLSTSRTSQ